MNTNFIYGVVCISLLSICISCSNSDQDLNKESTNHVPTATFKVVDLPSSLVNGDAYPTDSNEIDNWLSQPYVDNEGITNQENVISHTWALWANLTMETDQPYEGRNLRVYETWYTPQDVMRAMQYGTSLAETKRGLGTLQKRNKFKFGHEGELNPTAGDISGKVKYNSSMAEQALVNRYFDSIQLSKKIKPGQISRIAFKSDAAMLKPIYRVLTDMNRVKGKKDTYFFNIWTGKEDGGKPDGSFSDVVYVTTDNMSGEIDNINTFSIESFIYHDMSEAEAETYNASDKEGNQFVDTARAGDPVILLGMHVSTRETRRWTWQSFYWTKNPNNPVFPSSATIAVGRKNLVPSGPQAHYAVSIGYSMMSPALPYEVDEPINMNEQGSSSVYALNPYIEGTFTKDVFPLQQIIYEEYGYYEQFISANDVGIRSNCMSCHSQAAYAANLAIDTLDYFLANQYVNRNAPWFNGKIQLDFAWSLKPGSEKPLELRKE